MQTIYQPTNYPSWFTNASGEAKLTSNEIAEVINASPNYVRQHLRKLESFESIGNQRPSARKPTKYFAKSVVLKFIETLPKK
jgi:Winged helix-turn-helix DNA-binding